MGPERVRRQERVERRGSLKAERVFGQVVSPEYLSLIGITPVRGRLFNSEIDKPGTAPVVFITDRFWRSEANVRAALRFASSQPAQTAQGFVGQVDAALSHDARSRLGAVNAPTLVIHGAVDQLSPKENGEELARLIRGAELLTLPDVGHAVNLEGQRAVNGALRGVWKRVP